MGGVGEDELAGGLEIDALVEVAVEVADADRRELWLAKDCRDALSICAAFGDCRE
jgi:hypothetical protein